MDPNKITEASRENKFKIQNLETGEICIKHVNDLNKTYMTDTKMVMKAIMKQK